MTPQIQSLPSEEDIKRYVDMLITPERADEEGMALAELILLLANPEDDMIWHLANVVAKHAWSKTEDFDEAYSRFARFAKKPVPEKQDRIHELSQEM